jgi:hypothetical protein
MKYMPTQESTYLVTCLEVLQADNTFVHGSIKWVIPTVHGCLCQQLCPSSSLQELLGFISFGLEFILDQLGLFNESPLMCIHPRITVLVQVLDFNSKLFRSTSLVEIVHNAFMHGFHIAIFRSIQLGYFESIPRSRVPRKVSTSP